MISRIEILPNIEKKVTSAVARLKEVKEVYHLAGNGGMWMKTDVPDIAGVENFIKDKLGVVNGIKNIATVEMIVIRSLPDEEALTSRGTISRPRARHHGRRAWRSRRGAA